MVCTCGQALAQLADSKDISRIAQPEHALIMSPTAALETGKAKAVYNVRDYGAVGDGKTLDSPAINRAIEECSKAGGGTVCLPAGTYLSGSIHLTSNINLLIDAGATILGAPQDMKAYDPAEPFEGPAYQDGGHTYFHNSLIWGENLTNVSITGQGMINGGGLISNANILDPISGFSNFGRANPAPVPTPSRAGAPGQQVHRAEVVPECFDPRHHDLPRRPFCRPGDRLRQHDHRQRDHGHQPRRPGHRLLPERNGFELPH